MSDHGDGRRRLRFQDRIFLLALAAGGLPTLAVIVLLWLGGYPGGIAALLVVLLLLWWLMLAVAVRRGVTAPLRSLANLLESLREGDYTVRGRTGGARDALSEVHEEANRLTEALKHRRLEDLEAASLLGKVLDAIDIGVLIFDEQGRLQSINPWGSRLFRASPARLAGRSAEDLGVAPFLEPGRERNAAGLFGYPERRFNIRCQRFRSHGEPYDLLVVSDLSRTLREEERDAWRKLIRVIGHEINNSLSPIKSVADSLALQIDQDRFEGPRAATNLRTIKRRAEGLQRFVGRYARLAKLPPPALRSVRLRPLVERVTQLAQMPEARLDPDAPDLSLRVDPDQMEQVLINLLRNAREAGQDQGHEEIDIRWGLHQDRLWLEIADRGAGIANPDNLFTPFFTTKANGSGIGLLLSRNIVDAHDGSLRLSNREGGGCVARLELPWEAR